MKKCFIIVLSFIVLLAGYLFIDNIILNNKIELMQSRIDTFSIGEGAVILSYNNDVRLISENAGIYFFADGENGEIKLSSSKIVIPGGYIDKTGIYNQNDERVLAFD